MQPDVFPRRLQWLLRGPLSASQSFQNALKRINRPHFAASEPVHIIKRALPSGLDIEIQQVVPRFDEGGAFVKYTRKPTAKDADIEAATKDHLSENPIKPWFNPFQKVDAARVRGRPWIEDLYRIPSQRFRVEFLPNVPEAPAVELTQEALYSLFRPYGKLVDIERQPSDSKIEPRYAVLEFTRLKYAVLARNCMHGFKVSEQNGGGKCGTVLKLKYQRRIKLFMIKDWIISHPRIVIPAIAALIAALTAVVFDPIRTFFIKMKVKSTLPIEDNPVVRWVSNQASKANIMYFGHHGADRATRTAIWQDRQEDITQLQSWLSENVETFIVIHGPRGSGKRELVLDQAVKNHKYKVVIDCKQIQDARGDTAKIARTANQVGYRPIFSWMNSISSFVDLASQGMIGTKTGFSETLDTQLSKIWHSTTTALKMIATEGRSKDDKDAHLGDDEYLEAHPEKRPVVVIDNFLHNASESSVVYDKITEWAAGLTAGNVAHVIFLTTDVSFAKPLSKALPNQVFRTISLGDCSPTVGKNFVLDHLTYEPENESVQSGRARGLEDLDSCIDVVGGRVTDLEFMAHRIEAGETPRGKSSYLVHSSHANHMTGAVNRIIEQSASEILKMFLVGDSADKQWSREQAWHLIKSLANTEDDVLPYHKVLLSGLFGEDGETALRALEQAELICIISINGFPQEIKPGRPVYRTVFKRLAENKTLSSRLDLTILSWQISNENKSIGKLEEELRLIGSLPKQPRELSSRIHWLLQKLHNSQVKISQYEEQSAALQRVLQH
jgi:hypothetical protein